jgi:hypothetical protein
MASVIYPSNYYTVSGTHQSASLSVLGRIKDRILVRRLADVLPLLPPSGGCLRSAPAMALCSPRSERRVPARLFALDLRFARLAKRSGDGHQVSRHCSSSSLPSGDPVT